MIVVRMTLVAALLVVGGCSVSTGAGSPSPSRDPASLAPASIQPSRIPTAEPPGSPGPINLPASVIDPVVAETARLANVPIDQVVVRSAEAVTFPDGGLGCPVDGMVYIQVQVDGFKIVTAASGTTYDFRGSGADSFRLCTKGAG